MEKVMWASVMVVAPRPAGQPMRVCRITNRNRSDRPVITSGMMRGADIMPDNSVRPRNRPMRASASPARVPNSVATVADTMAMRSDNSAAVITSPLWNSLGYHSSEKPPQRVARREELKEKPIITRIGT